MTQEPPRRPARALVAITVAWVVLVPTAVAAVACHALGAWLRRLVLGATNDLDRWVKAP